MHLRALPLQQEGQVPVLVQAQVQAHLTMTHFGIFSMNPHGRRFGVRGTGLSGVCV